MKRMQNNKILFLLAIVMAMSFLSSCVRETNPREKNQTDLPERLLLKNYNPKSIYNVPETIVNSALFPAIDMHAHDYAKNHEGLEQWVNTLDKVGIKKVMILSYKHGAEFDSLVDLYSAYPDRFQLWCGIDYSEYKSADFEEKAIAELMRCYKMGARGVGELGDKGSGLYYSKPPADGMHPDDERMDPIWEKCAELGMPVNIHVADPKWMYLEMDSTNDGMMNAYKWRLDNKPGIKSHEEMINILERTVMKHPKTTFIACHIANCSYDLNKVAELLNKYPNLHLDISARFAEICATPRTTRDFMIKYQNRLLYGTDMGRSENMYKYTFRLLETSDEHIYSDYSSYHWPLHALNLPGETLEKLYRSNAEKIINTKSL
ncbi:MAG: amidohydrolase family protein [Bacteroidales bacterium]